MEKLCNFFFELSNEDRLDILYALTKKPLKITEISNSLDISNQESSRHTARLTEVGLIAREPTGHYHISHFGNFLLRQIPSFEFIVDHQEYFTKHSMANVPDMFANRIGIFRNSIYAENITLSFYYIEKIIREADEILWEMSNQYLVNTFEHRIDAMNRGVKLKELEQKNIVFPRQVREWYRSQPELLQSSIEAHNNNLVEERLVEEIDATLYMSEKEAFIAFPIVEGSYDMVGFVSEDEAFIEWCKDLFKHYWALGHPRDKVVESSYDWLEENPKHVEILDKIAVRGADKEDERLQQLIERGFVKGLDITLLGEIVLAWAKKPKSSIPIDFSRYWSVLYES